MNLWILRPLEASPTIELPPRIQGDILGSDGPTHLTPGVPELTHDLENVPAKDPDLVVGPVGHLEKCLIRIRREGYDEGEARCADVGARRPSPVSPFITTTRRLL